MSNALLFLAKTRVFPPYVAPDLPATVLNITSPVAGEVSEGASLVYVVTLSRAATVESLLSFAVSGTASGGDIGTIAFSDGVTLDGSTLTVPIGVSSFTVTVPTIDDATEEGAETVVLTIDGVVGTGTITANDTAAPVAITGVSLAGAQPNDAADVIMRGQSSGGGRSNLPHIRPANGEVVYRTNVDFHWTPIAEFNQATNDSTIWQGTVKNYPAATTAATFNSVAGYTKHTVSALPAGEYTWDLYDPSTSTTMIADRRFTIHASATEFVVPLRANVWAAALTNSARTCLQSSITHYQPGGARRLNYDRLWLSYNTFKAPAALTAYGSFGIGAAEYERTRAYTLATLSAANGGAAEYTTEALRRLFDPTAGIAYIDPTGTSGLTFTNDDVYRPWLEAVAVLYRQFKGSMTAPQKASCLDAIGRRLAYFARTDYHGCLYDPTGTYNNTFGRDLLELCRFGGHKHNVVAVCTLGALAVAPEADALTTEYSNLKANAQTFAGMAEILLDVMDPALTDAGGMPEGQGYGRASADNFATTMHSIANLLGVDYNAKPSLKAYAEIVPLLHPTAPIHNRGLGDDSGVVWRDVAEMVGQRVGGLVQTARSIATSGNTATTAENSSANYHFFLGATAEPSASGWTPVQSAINEHVASHWTDVTDVNRAGFSLYAFPFWAWNHTWAAPLGETIEHNTQALVRSASVYDAINTEHQSTEGGYSHSYPGVISIDGRTASTRAPKGSKQMRGIRSHFAWRSDANAGSLQATVRDATQSYGMVPTVPVAGGSNVGNGYMRLVCSRPSSVVETWTFTCTNAGTGAFSVVGSVSGAQTAWTAGASIQAASEFVNNYISGCIVQGTVAFSVGDTFTVAIKNVTKVVGSDITIAGVIKLSHLHLERASSGTWERNLPTADVQTPTSLVVSGTTLAATHSAGHGHPVGATVYGDISGVTSQTAANAKWPGTVASDTLVNFTVSGLTSATLTGTNVVVNYSPSMLGGVAYVRNKMRAAGGRGLAELRCLVPSGSITTSRVGWDRGDNHLLNAAGNSVAHELGSINYRDPRRRVWPNTIDIPATTSYFGWGQLWLLNGVSLASLSYSTTGTAPNRSSTASIGYGGKVYSITFTEGTTAPTITYL